MIGMGFGKNGSVLPVKLDNMFMFDIIEMNEIVRINKKV
jgi:hypothetical protein